MDNRLAAKKNVSNIDHIRLNFGRHNGKTPDQVSVIDPNYIIWMWDKFDDPPCSEALYNFCKVEAAKWSRTSEK